jgi:hypothetical protein
MVIRVVSALQHKNKNPPVLVIEHFAIVKDSIEVMIGKPMDR